MATAEQIAATPKGRSIRGPLRYQITTSSPQIEAGTKFSIYIRITNPYDVPVLISSVSTLLPVEFIDVALLERDRRKQAIRRHLRSLEGYGSDKKSLFPSSNRSSDSLPQVSGQSISSVPDPSSTISDGEISDIMASVQTAKDKEALTASASEQLRTALSVLNTPPAETQPMLQPGNSVIQVFTLKTSRSIFFPPNIYLSSVRIEYLIDESKNIDVADYQLNVRAPLKAIIYGALVGSFFGFVLKDLLNNQVVVAVIQQGLRNAAGLSYALSLVSSMMIAGIVVVAFARKKDAQPILSVEDFWGGVFVGFLAGYTGKSFLDQAVFKTATAATPH